MIGRLEYEFNSLNLIASRWLGLGHQTYVLPAVLLVAVAYLVLTILPRSLTSLIYALLIGGLPVLLASLIKRNAYMFSDHPVSIGINSHFRLPLEVIAMALLFYLASLLTQRHSRFFVLAIGVVAGYGLATLSGWNIRESVYLGVLVGILWSLSAIRYIRVERRKEKNGIYINTQ